MKIFDYFKDIQNMTNIDVLNHSDTDQHTDQCTDQPNDQPNDQLTDQQSQSLDEIQKDLIHKVEPMTDYCIVLQIPSENKYQVFLNDDIVHDPNLYRNLFTILNRAKENEVIEMYINSYGGSVITGIMIISAMKKCKAKIITYNCGIAMSIGSSIWLYGDELRLFPGAITMFHCTLHGDQGYSTFIKDKADFIISTFRNILNRALKLNVLTQEEVDNILTKNHELYIGYDDMIKRINNSEKE